MIGLAIAPASYFPAKFESSQKPGAFEYYTPNNTKNEFESSSPQPSDSVPLQGLNEARYLRDLIAVLSISSYVITETSSVFMQCH